jgi:hypothetical protein
VQLVTLLVGHDAIHVVYVLVSYYCGTDVNLEVHSCHEFCVINLDGPLFICTKEEQTTVISFLRAESVTGAEMHRRISMQYGNSVVSQRMVYEWIERFKNGRTSIKHEEGARRVWFMSNQQCNQLHNMYLHCG